MLITCLYFCSIMFLGLLLSLCFKTTITFQYSICKKIMCYHHCGNHYLQKEPFVHKYIRLRSVEKGTKLNRSCLEALVLRSFRGHCFSLRRCTNGVCSGDYAARARRCNTDSLRHSYLHLASYLWFGTPIRPWSCRSEFTINIANRKIM